MMIRSMTGYGRGEALLYDRKFIVEIKSVNHRYNDVSIKIPRVMNSFEDKIRKIIAKEVFRGKTDIYISYQTFSKKDIKINFNESLADAYNENIKNIKNKYGYTSDNMLDIILNLPEILTVDNLSIDEKSFSEMIETLEIATQNALSQFIFMRQTEGETLKDDIILKSQQISEITETINKRVPKITQDLHDKLLARVKEFLEDVSIDENRILTEVTLQADKTCIDEELIRLRSHISQLTEILLLGGTVGRKLDFLIQEMNREANTIGSKSNDIEVTRCVVDLKSEIEKIREQIQNIE